MDSSGRVDRMEYTEDNIEKLASEVVDSWDSDTLVGFAHTRLIIDYIEDEDLFHDDVELMDMDEPNLPEDDPRENR